VPLPNSEKPFLTAFPAAVRQDFHTASAYERLLLRGCTEKNIRQLAEQEYLLVTGENDGFDRRSVERKWQTDKLKSWTQRLRKLAKEMDEAGSKQLEFEGHRTFNEAIFEVRRKVPRSDRSVNQGRDSLVLSAESHRLREAADDFEAAREVKSWQHSNRRVTPAGFFTAMFWHYCCQGGLDGQNGKSKLEDDAGSVLAKAHEIAGKKDCDAGDSGPWLRMRVTRLQHSSPELYSELEAFVKNYVNTFPTGEPTLLLWFRRAEPLEQKSRQK
jgi:hypothetical protein